MRRFLTLKLVVAGLVCLAAVSGQDAPAPEQPLADPSAAPIEITTLAAPEEPAIVPNGDEPLPEEPAPEPEPEPDFTTMAAPEEEVPQDAPVEGEPEPDLTMMAAPEGEVPQDAPVEGEPAPAEGDMAAADPGAADEGAVDATAADGGADSLLNLDGVTQDQINLDQISDVLGETTMGGNLNEAVYETVSSPADTLGGALDTAAGTVNDLANVGGSGDGGAGVLGGALDNALPGSGSVLNNGILGAPNQPVAPPAAGTTTTTTTTDATADATAAGAGGDTVMPPVQDKAAAQEAAPAIPDHLYITAFECDVDSVLVTEQDNYLTCTVSAEASAGVSAISAAFYNPPMNKRLLLNFGPEQLVKGDATKGTWSLDLTVPKGTDQGVWSLGFADQGAFYGLEIVDAKGNVVNYAQAEALKTVAPLQQQLTIQSYKGNTVAYPQANIVSSSGLRVFGLSCDLAAVTVTAAPADVPCSALVMPDEAGLGKVLAYLVGPTGKTVLPLTFDESGERLLIPATNTTEEMFQINGKLTVPMWAEPGAYGLAEAGAFQPRTLSHAGTLRLVSPATLARKPKLQVTSANDKAAPRVSNFYCNQGQKVDLGLKDAVNVNCLLRASDDLSGISYAAMHFVSPSRNEAVEFAFVPPSPGLGPFPNVAVPQVAETVSAAFPPATEAGAWTLARAVVADQSGNYREYTATELDQLNVQTFFLVQSPSKTFAIAPRAGSENNKAGDVPGQSTSAAPAGSRPSALLLAGTALAGGLLGLASYVL